MSHRQQGFTIVELITVMVVIGVLSAVALPMLTSGGNGMAGAAFRNELASTLRYAQKSAVSHRRLVCANVTTSAVSLTIAQAANQTACDTQLQGPDGSEVASRDAAVTATGGLVGMIYFQPGGTISTNGAGTATAAGVINVTGQPAINIQGATGYVE
ncbi:prepilin-type N-terminal cleavage/methylation domain-containing protein [Pseudoduganella sp. LjRoot289]|uniref:pilus assembly FimT family protein n=1 Tax=Pseudoduganella sp. LjRoot289 TaxID=3342314 RepID=UPI003ECE6330